jgi:hypothetical protein
VNPWVQKNARMPWPVTAFPVCSLSGWKRSGTSGLGDEVLPHHCVLEEKWLTWLGNLGVVVEEEAFFFAAEGAHVDGLDEGANHATLVGAEVHATRADLMA